MCQDGVACAVHSLPVAAAPTSAEQAVVPVACLDPHHDFEIGVSSSTLPITCTRARHETDVPEHQSQAGSQCCLLHLRAVLSLLDKMIRADWIARPPTNAFRLNHVNLLL